MRSFSSLEESMEDLVSISFGTMGMMFLIYLALPNFPQVVSEVVGYFSIFFYSTVFIIGLIITTMMTLLAILSKRRITTSYLGQDNRNE